MSTFRGIVKEFPQIQIDYFRRVQNEAPPLACFLSHVHSDHLQGMESLKSPFVYCSPATREILLRLEKYPHRMNFSKGILEYRVQTYRHLKNLLKIIPLETPTVIELRPGYEIRVTLFDANHCVGAVMFLIEGQGNAILYTGDIRSEQWWVNGLVRNPVLLPYAKCVKNLDCIYLDTTFASKAEPYREFPSKAAGLVELVQKVQKYPQDTLFYVESWTFGYENVWILLSSLLESPVHLDRYRFSLYWALANTANGAPECHEAHQLCGFMFGNHRKNGCLTLETDVRIHSCERGTSCPNVMGNENIVKIVPIISRLANGDEIHEMGIGGGKGDLDQSHELAVGDSTQLGLLMQLCASKIDDKDLLVSILALLNSAQRINLGMGGHKRLEEDNVTLEELVNILSKSSSEKQSSIPVADHEGQAEVALPKIITFPYSRHSSYLELCSLVEAFQPKDVHPCTVDEPNWTPELSMHSLFGHLCFGEDFHHDMEMMELYEERIGIRHDSDTQPQHTQSARTETQRTANSGLIDIQPSSQEAQFFTPANPNPLSSATTIDPLPPQTLITESPRIKHQRCPSLGYEVKIAKSVRQWAYMAARGMSMNPDCDSWDAFGGLSCCTGSVAYSEAEL